MRQLCVVISDVVTVVKFLIVVSLVTVSDVGHHTRIQRFLKQFYFVRHLIILPGTLLISRDVANVDSQHKNKN